MQASPATSRYARCIEASKRVRWDIDRDVIRGRALDARRKFLPDSLSQADRLDFLDEAGKRFFGQVQGRTYANMFGLVERYIGAKMLEISRDYWMGDQVALEALVRFTDEELKHQELFRRVEALAAEVMPAGYRFMPHPDDVARAVLGKSTWAVLALTCHIELFTQAHYRASLEPDKQVADLFRDVFLFHWKEESQHAILDELEWRREHARLSGGEHDAAVQDLIALVGAVDSLLRLQAAEDARYFLAQVRLAPAEAARIEPAFLAAYRWQFIVSGVQEPRFQEVLGSLTTEAQRGRIGAALETLFH
jgi:hypothetical protein